MGRSEVVEERITSVPAGGIELADGTGPGIDKSQGSLLKSMPPKDMGTGPMPIISVGRILLKRVSKPSSAIRMGIIDIFSKPKLIRSGMVLDPSNTEKFISRGSCCSFVAKPDISGMGGNIGTSTFVGTTSEGASRSGVEALLGMGSETICPRRAGGMPRGRLGLPSASPCDRRRFLLLATGAGVGVGNNESTAARLSKPPSVIGDGKEPSLHNNEGLQDRLRGKEAYAMVGQSSAASSALRLLLMLAEGEEGPDKGGEGRWLLRAILLARV
jgi:hypothetical protein